MQQYEGVVDDGHRYAAEVREGWGQWHRANADEPKPWRTQSGEGYFTGRDPGQDEELAAYTNGSYPLAIPQRASSDSDSYRERCTLAYLHQFH